MVDLLDLNPGSHMAQTLPPSDPVLGEGVPAPPMPQADINATQLVPEATSSLTHRTARGFAWMISQAAATKVVTFLGPIVYLWYLSPEDLGLVAIASMFSVIPLLVQQ